MSSAHEAFLCSDKQVDLKSRYSSLVRVFGFCGSSWVFSLFRQDNAMKHHASTPVSGLLISLIALTSSCTSTRNYSKFAEAGAAYSAVVASLADKASVLQADGTSYELLAKRAELMGYGGGSERRNPHIDTGTHENEGRSKRLGQMLIQANEKDIAAIHRNRLAKAVASDLKEYFDALGGLASSDAPAGIGKKAGEIITRLNDDIRRANPVIPVSSSGMISPLVNHMTEAMLRDELQQRKQTIEGALEVFRLLNMQIETDIVGHASENDRGFRQMLITEPFINGGSQAIREPADISSWIQYRQTSLNGNSKAAEADKIIDGSRKSYASFRSALDSMTTGRQELSIEELGHLFDEIVVFSKSVNSL